MTDSPCNDICIIDQESGLCIGCSRSQKEIEGWNTINDKEKEQLLIKIKTRNQNPNNLPKIIRK